MNKEQKRKLGLLAALGLALLVSGTFAFTAFNQRAINDRADDIMTEVSGRVHDYYNRTTGNKDVFAENYGGEQGNPVMVRIRLSEFMEIKKQGESDFTPVVMNSVREEIDTWTTWLPSTNDTSNRRDDRDSGIFDTWSKFTLGWQRGQGEEAEFAPWYMPTFNHNNNDFRTAAAGHARDYIEGTGATDVTVDGTTHPGDGKDAYWTAASSAYDNAVSQWPGSHIVNEVKQHLPQERPPITIEQWNSLHFRDKVGDYWVIDYETGWAYWASLLKEGEATSYLLDAAEMTSAVVDNIVNGSYYYGIHVDSQFTSRLGWEKFLEAEPDGDPAHHPRLGALLDSIRNGAYGDGNPNWNEDSRVDDFTFDRMNPGRIFTMGGQQYRYLENMGEGNHLIIRDIPITNHSFNSQNAFLGTWYNDLAPAVRESVAPIAASFTTGSVAHAAVNFSGPGLQWLPNNLTGAVAADVTQVVAGGVKRAFALSLADVTKLSQPGASFTNHAERGGGGNLMWHLRTPGASGRSWFVDAGSHMGRLSGEFTVDRVHESMGIRPALIIHQATT